MRSRVRPELNLFLVCALAGLASACTGFRSGPKAGSSGQGGAGGQADGGAAEAPTGLGGAGGRDGGGMDTAGMGMGGANRTDAGADATDARDGAPDAICGSPTDPKNCGTCGHDCTALTNVSPSATGVECRAGVCYVPPAACATGSGHCSARPDDGCEASLTDSANCGACGTRCTGATTLCTQGTSGPKCASSCVAPAPDLCVSSCVDLKIDPRNCGTCGHDCTTLTNVNSGATGVECRAGACYVPPVACAAGYGHCSTRADDGCETSLKTPTSCGQCNKACTSPTALCSTAGATPACSSSCVAPSPDLCVTKCVSLASDPTNCGVCNHDCTTLPNLKAGATGVECRSGVCYVPPSACASGRAHCSTRTDDGCEADLSTPASCGSCSLVCSGTTPLCSLQSTPATCLPNCSGTSPDVCGTKCVNRSTDAKNCGACGHDCGALTNVRPGATAPAVQCVAGACVIQPAGCVSGFGHCTTRADDGCETDLTRPATCGSCLNMCVAPTGLCSTTGGSPACSSSCISPNPDLCGSRCVNRTTDPTNCGSCGHDCTVLAHINQIAGVTCNSTGGCVVAQSACASGFANCSTVSNDLDGCETPTNTTTNCGGCRVPCAITNGTGNCSTGLCVRSCSAGSYICGTACIANSMPCNGTCPAAAPKLCNGSCLASSACCAAAAGAVHYVDGVGGVDAADHGEPGACAYKTITYALAHATGQINLSPGTYSSEAWPLVLTGTQQIACNPNGTGRATIKMLNLLGSYVIRLSGSQNALTDCIVNGNINPVVCIDVTANGNSASSPHLLSNLDIGDCNSTGVLVETNIANVRVQNSLIHGTFYGILWNSGSSGQMLNNSFAGGVILDDIICQDSGTGVSGSGNVDSTQVGGFPICSHCSGCTF